MPAKRPASPMINLARGKPTSQSSNWARERFPTSNVAVDGNKNKNFWVGKSCTHTGAGDSKPWWAVDLGKATDVYGVELTTVSDCCYAYRMDNFIVGLTNNPPSSMSPRVHGYWTCGQYPGKVPEGGHSLLIPCAADSVPARYVVILAAEYMNICELEVYEAGQYTSTNLARGRPAFQISTWTYAEAIYAVDGSKAWSACTEGSSKPWWAVHLAQLTHVALVKISNDINTNHPSRLDNFLVYLSNTRPTVGSALAVASCTLCAQYNGRVPLGATVSVTCSKAAFQQKFQYAIVQSSQYNALCTKEVEVYTANLCANGLCKNGGTCTQTGSTFQCKCTTGWIGDNCDVNRCNPNPCKNGGVCSADANGFACACVGGYTGNDCSANRCAPNPCKNGGVCSANANAVTCACDGGYVGNDCSVNPCHPNPCKNGGVCSATKTSFTCKCDISYAGEDCSVNRCNPNPCKNGGVCSADANSLLCDCAGGYLGNDCSIDRCVPNPCKNGGVCSATANAVTCACVGGYVGNDCSVNHCHPNPCKNGGVCSATKTSFTCKCDISYAGEDCSVNRCNPNPCKNGGVCSANANSSSCACVGGYLGNDCSIDRCIPNPCKNGGVCSASSKSITCTCVDGYIGIDCGTISYSGCPHDFIHLPEAKGCYKPVLSNMEWPMAAMRCRSLHKDAHLVYINNANEHHYVNHLLLKLNHHAGCNQKYGLGDGWWTGGHQVAMYTQSFVWRSTEHYGNIEDVEMSYTKWHTGEPNHFSDSGPVCTCAFRGRMFDTWDDCPCTDAFCSLCEIDL